jgi:hypothetical protein
MTMMNPSRRAPMPILVLMSTVMVSIRLRRGSDRCPRTLHCVDVAADRYQRACLGWSDAATDVHALGFLFLDRWNRLTSDVQAAGGAGSDVIVRQLLAHPS